MPKRGFQKGHKGFGTPESYMVAGRKISKAMKGVKKSEEHKRKLKENHKGFTGCHHSEESREKHRLSAIEQGKRGISDETRLKMRNSHLGKSRCGNPENWKHTEETKKKIGEKCKGRKPSEESRMKNSESHKGEKSYLWQGGISKENQKIRQGIEIRLWREVVFARDNWTCQKCRIRNGNGETVYLHPHHIKNFSQYKELRTSIENGITFCKKCHYKFHKLYGFKDNNQEQVDKFLI